MRACVITIGAISLLLLSTLHHLQAQDKFEDLLKKSDKQFEQLQKESNAELDKLKNSIDKEFAQILDKAWKELELNTGRKLHTKPKPDKVPVARPKQEPVKEPEVVPEKKPPVKEPEIKVPEKKPEAKVPEKKPVPKPPVKKVEKKPVPVPTPQVPKPPVPTGETVSFSFFDTPVTVACNKGLRVPVGNEISNKTITTYFAKMCQTKYQPSVKHALAIKKQLRLNDYGYCLLLDNIAQAVYGRSTNSRNLFVWFMLVKSGFDARVGYSENQAYLMLPTKTRLFGAPYYELNNVTYYITFLGTTKQSIKSLYSYDGKHEGSENPINMSIDNPPGINKKVSRKEYSFAYFDKNYTVPVNVNSNVIDYYEFYPQTSLDVYFDASISPESAQALLEGLRPIVSGKPEKEAVNMILRFVQTAFEYKTDDEQFQREKHFFVEETLFYPFCDCEDRSFLFAFLVTNLVGLDVLGLHYPGHVATAVQFSGDVQGDSVTYNNSKYIICDPTYINANYGECMPKFKNVNPKMVRVQMN